MRSTENAIPNWLAAVIITAVLVLVGGGGYYLFNRTQTARPDTPAELQKTQAAELPGDPPSGGGASQVQEHQSAN